MKDRLAMFSNPDAKFIEYVDKMHNQILKEVLKIFTDHHFHLVTITIIEEDIMIQIIIMYHLFLLSITCRQLL